MITYDFTHKRYNIFKFIEKHTFNRFSKDINRMIELSGIKNSNHDYYYFLYDFNDDIKETYGYDVWLNEFRSYRYSERTKNKIINENKIIFGPDGKHDVERVVSLKEGENWQYGYGPDSILLKETFTLGFRNEETLTHFLLEYR